MEFNNTIEKIVDDIAAGHVEEGLAQLESLEKTANDEQKYTLAEAYFELGHIELAHALIDELLEIYVDEGELYAFKAELLIDDGKEDEAIEILLEISEQDPAYLRGQLLLADLYQLQGLDEVAEQRLISAYEQNKSEPLLVYALGEFYLQRGDYNKSIPYLKQSYYNKQALPGFNLALSLAEAYSACGEFEEALPFFEKGLNEQLEIKSLFSYGYTAYQLGDYRLAIKQFEKLKEIDPEYFSLYLYLAKAYEADDDLKKARSVIQEGFSKDEYNEELYLLGGKCALKASKPDEAEQLLRKLLSLNPTHVEGLRTLLAFLKHEERYEDILELIDYAKEYGEEEPTMKWYAATAYWQTEQYEQAGENYRKAEASFHDDPNFLEEYGEFLLEEGERHFAIEKLKQALQIDPNKTHLQDMINRIEHE